MVHMNLSHYHVIIHYRYEMVFKQAVSSEDMYLQMSGKNPSTASCEDLVVRNYVAKVPP